MIVQAEEDPWTTVRTHLPDGVDNSSPSPLATFLGLFSLGIGLTEVLLPRRVAEASGVPHPQLLRAYGIRELIAGVGILSSRNPAYWIWSRVAGDAMDLATIAATYREASTKERQRLLVSAGAVAGVAVLGVICAAEHTCAAN